jgi:hypothetical protein
MRKSVALTLAASLTCLSASGLAQEVPVGERDAWRFPAVDPAEMVASGVLLAGGIALRFGPTWEDDARWRSGILFDDAVADAAFAEDPVAHRAWTLTGDVPWIAALAWSGLDPLVAGVAYDWRAAAQMALMNAEAFSVLTAVLWGSQYLVPRERPLNTRLCSDEDRAADRALDDYGTVCGGENGARAFIGGHVAVIAATTTLTCFHHAYSPIYGGGVGDALPCATGIVGTGLVFAARTITATHYFSDNALGLGVGVMSAMVPWGLHYARGSPPATSAAFVVPIAMPAANGRGGTIGVSGAMW